MFEGGVFIRGRATTLARPRGLLCGPYTACGPFVVRGDSAPPLASTGKGENLRQGEGKKGRERRPSPYARSSLRAASALGNHGEGEGFLRGVWLPAPARQVWWRRPLRVTPAALFAGARRCGLLSTASYPSRKLRKATRSTRPLTFCTRPMDEAPGDFWTVNQMYSHSGG